MRTDPFWSDVEIESIYDNDFDDDPVAPSVFRRLPEEKKADIFRYQREKMRKYVCPLISTRIDLRSARVLDVRSRFGGLAAELKDAGANVECVDLFPDGVEWVRSRVGVPATLSPQPSQLLSSLRGPFDVITMMTVHTPGHVPSPTALFADAYRLLSPGGLLLVEEKDIRRPSWLKGRFPLRPPLGKSSAHYYHFTVESLRRFVERAGFEVEAVEWLPYVTTLRHFYLLARKPVDEKPLRAASTVVHRPYAMYAHLHYLLVKSTAIRPIRSSYGWLRRSVPQAWRQSLKERLPSLARWVRAA